MSNFYPPANWLLVICSSRNEAHFNAGVHGEDNENNDVVDDADDDGIATMTPVWPHLFATNCRIL